MNVGAVFFGKRQLRFSVYSVLFFILRSSHPHHHDRHRWHNLHRRSSASHSSVQCSTFALAGITTVLQKLCPETRRSRSLACTCKECLLWAWFDACDGCSDAQTEIGAYRSSTGEHARFQQWFHILIAFSIKLPFDGETIYTVAEHVADSRNGCDVDGSGGVASFTSRHRSCRAGCRRFTTNRLLVIGSMIIQPPVNLIKYSKH